MRSLHRNSCIRFRKRQGETDYVSIENQREQGCYAWVGHKSGKHVLQLEDNETSTCMSHKTILHEMMHLTGLWHEQMRSDRDEYIRVRMENVQPGKTSAKQLYKLMSEWVVEMYPQFKKLDSANWVTYGVRYDYRSVMHYHKYAFGMLSDSITMETVDPSVQVDSRLGL